MANRLILNRIDRITMVRKGTAMAKHPDLRTGVVEVVKATETPRPSWYFPSPTPADNLLRELLHKPCPQQVKKAATTSSTPALFQYASGRYQ